MTRAELLACLHRDPENDACILRIGEADYGCEERDESTPPLCWLLLLTGDGKELSREVPEKRLSVLHLSEGSFLRLSDLDTQ